MPLLETARFHPAGREKALAPDTDAIRKALALVGASRVTVGVPPLPLFALCCLRVNDISVRFRLVCKLFAFV